MSKISWVDRVGESSQREGEESVVLSEIPVDDTQLVDGSSTPTSSNSDIKQPASFTTNLMLTRSKSRLLRVSDVLGQIPGAQSLSLSSESKPSMSGPGLISSMLSPGSQVLHPKVKVIPRKAALFCSDPSLGEQVIESLSATQPNFCPEYTVLERTPLKQRPIVIQTPKGTKLRRQTDYGLVLVFGEEESQQIERYLQRISHLISSSTASSGGKCRKFDLSPITEMPELGRRRCKTQNRVKGISAKAVAAEADKENSEEFQWLHLVAHRFLGREAQVPEDLVSGTSAMNKHMSVIERSTTAIIRNKSAAVGLRVNAQLEGDGETVINISYILEIAGKEIPLEFNETSDTKPTRADKEIIRALFKIVEASIAREAVQSTSPGKFVSLVTTPAPSLAPAAFDLRG